MTRRERTPCGSTFRRVVTAEERAWRDVIPGVHARMCGQGLYTVEIEINGHHVKVTDRFCEERIFRDPSAALKFIEELSVPVTARQGEEHA